jgi:predicted small lipoprotein YifL
MVRDFPAPFRSGFFALAMAAAIGASALAGCGIKGPLKPAQPAATPAGTPPAEPATAPAPTPPGRAP